MLRNKVRSSLHQILRRLGWEVRRLENVPLEQNCLRQILKLGQPAVILDVGANVGQFGDMAMHIGYNGIIVSFEAQPAVHAKLEAHAAATSKRWIVAPCAALGEAKGKLEINISENSWSSSILPMHETHLNAAPNSRYIGKQSIDVRRLDEIAQNYIPKDGNLFIKIDTQGYELMVMKGASGLLPRTTAIQLELSVTPLYQGAPPLIEMISFMSDLGFTLFTLSPGFKDELTGRLLQIDGYFIRENM